MSSSNLTGTNQFISLQQAIDMTTTYRDNKEEILAPAYRGENILLLCETFDRSAFDALLSQEGCKSVRIYYGMEKNLQVRSLFVGVNDKNEDILPAEMDGTPPGESEGIIVETGTACPDNCPPPSPLNTD